MGSKPPLDGRGGLANGERGQTNSWSMPRFETFLAPTVWRPGCFLSGVLLFRPRALLSGGGKAVFGIDKKKG